MRGLTRFVVLAFVVAAGVAAFVAVRRSGPPSVEDTTRFAYVTTAHQLGVVGYRDPVGVISPDGTRVAFSEGRHLFTQQMGGGARIEAAAAEGQVRHATWLGTALIFEDVAAPSRWWIVKPDAAPAPLFDGRGELKDASGSRTVRVNDLRQLAGAPDGAAIASVANGPSGSELWRIAADGTTAAVTPLGGRLSFPAWTWGGDIACVIANDGRSRLSIPCGQQPLTTTPELEVIGPVAFSSDDRTVYFASPNPRGTLDVWSAPRSGGEPRQISRSIRDSYAPSTARDGTVLFKTQTYRTTVAELDLASRSIRELTAFQAETPSYSADGRRIAVTFGTWRRVIDDAKYPDIAQDIGLIAAGPGAGIQREPVEVIARSDSEDQAMTWSPNGKWIAFHSHKEQSDDVWLRSADGSSADKRLSFLGRGAEVGWPRWSADGRTVLFDGASPRTRRSAAFVVGVDQNSGQVTSEVTEVAITGVEGELTHAEWLPDSRTIAAVMKEGPGRHVVFTAPSAGGPARVVHRVNTEHDFPGLAVSPNGRDLAFVAPAAEGFFQIFRIPVAGGSPDQVTFDRSHKTQPAWSPDGQRIAFTIWEYIAQFSAITP